VQREEANHFLLKRKIVEISEEKLIFMMFFTKPHVYFDRF